MQLRTNEEAIRIIYQCAVEYRENLSNKFVLFITAKDNNTAGFETLFLPQNFKHLTGVGSRLSGADFFGLAVRNRLSPNEITLAKDGTTDLKLDVLPQLMNIHLTARMAGDYDYSKTLLVADKIAGTVTAALGFVQTKNIYLPKTALKADVRDITVQSTRRRIIAIFVKPRKDALYRQLTYIAKDISLDEVVHTHTIHDRIDRYNLVGATLPEPNKPLQERLPEAQKKADEHKKSPDG